MPLRRAVQAADHVVYQSSFSKRSSDAFLGEPSGSWEILPNAVDVDRFTPASHRPKARSSSSAATRPRPTGSSSGSRRSATCSPRIPGRASSSPAGWSPTRADDARLGLGGAVELLGRYAQDEAPGVFHRAHVLLHTKVNDPCPTTVIEAMACGLPVAYAASGGTVELVGDEAGSACRTPTGFERDEPPRADALAAAVSALLADREQYAVAARARAVARFGLSDWLERHAALFASLVSERQPAGRRAGRGGSPR